MTWPNNPAAMLAPYYQGTRTVTRGNRLVTQLDDVNPYRRCDDASPVRTGWENTELQNGDVLTWHAASQQWRPCTAATAGTASTMFPHSHSAPSDGGHLYGFWQ